MPLKTIRLSLARSPQFPDGDPSHSYEFRAPLDATGNLDKSAWPHEREFCTVKKFEHGVEAESGVLLHTRGGKWVFSYKKGDEDDESIFRMSSHAFIPGEYLSITEHDGVQRTFRIDSIDVWHPGQSEGVKVARWPRPHI